VTVDKWRRRLSPRARIFIPSKRAAFNKKKGANLSKCLKGPTKGGPLKRLTAKRGVELSKNRLERIVPWNGPGRESVPPESHTNAQLWNGKIRGRGGRGDSCRLPVFTRGLIALRPNSSKTSRGSVTPNEGFNAGTQMENIVDSEALRVGHATSCNLSKKGETSMNQRKRCQKKRDQKDITALKVTGTASGYSPVRPLYVGGRALQHLVVNTWMVKIGAGG